MILALLGPSRPAVAAPALVGVENALTRAKVAKVAKEYRAGGKERAIFPRIRWTRHARMCW